MKKYYFLNSVAILLCPILFLSCSKDENPEVLPEVEESQTLLSVTLASNFFPDLREVEYTETVYLTNNEGEVISSGELRNGTITELQELYDLTTQKLNLTFLRKMVFPEGTSYRIRTYTDVDPYEFSFENPLVKPWLEKATVKIINTGSRLEHFIHNHPSYTGIISDDNATFEIRLRQDPDQLFFTVKKETEDFKRYFLQKDVMTGTEVSVDFQELKPITDHLTLNLPENSFLYVSLRGAESTEPNNFYAGIGEIRATDGRTSHTFDIPEGLFQKYKLRMVLRQDQKEYVLDDITTSVDEHYDLPDWDLQSSSEGTAYSFISTDAADYYTVGFQYVPMDQPYDIVWTVSGRKTNEMNFNLPDLQEFITQDITNFSLEDLNLRTASLYRIEGISSYKDFIISQQDNYSSEKESITRSENLITLF